MEVGRDGYLLRDRGHICTLSHRDSNNEGFHGHQGCIMGKVGREESLSCLSCRRVGSGNTCYA